MNPGSIARAQFIAVRQIITWLPDTRAFHVKSRLLSHGGMRIAATARVHSRARFEGANIAIGSDTWIGAETFFAPSSDAPIAIGNRVDIAPRVSLITGTHKIGPTRRRAGDGLSEPITVEDGVWIGAGSVILGGVTIGKGAIVAAGSVVTRSVHPDTVVGGCPAQLIRHLENS